MGVFDWLKGSDGAPEPSDDVPRADVDWHSLEDAITAAITKHVASFSSAHPDETFYGFALDCNAYYANVLFCLNTTESLEASAREYAGSEDPDEIENQKEDLTWGLGDWRYHAFNLDSDEWQDDVPMLDDFAELPSDLDTEEFLVTCCRALIRAEQAGAFLPLRRTADFRVACIDHDEDVHAGDRRLDRTRTSY
jgi:hypothetical protein